MTAAKPENHPAGLHSDRRKTSGRDAIDEREQLRNRRRERLAIAGLTNLVALRRPVLYELDPAECVPESALGFHHPPR